MKMAVSSRLLLLVAGAASICSIEGVLKAGVSKVNGTLRPVKFVHVVLCLLERYDPSLQPLSQWACLWAATVPVRRTSGLFQSLQNILL